MAEANRGITRVLASLLRRLRDAMTPLAILLHQGEVKLTILTLHRLWLGALVTSRGRARTARTLTMVVATGLGCVDRLGASLAFSSSSGAGRH